MPIQTVIPTPLSCGRRIRGGGGPRFIVSMGRAFVVTRGSGGWIRMVGLGGLELEVEGVVCEDWCWFCDLVLVLLRIMAKDWTMG